MTHSSLHESTPWPDSVYTIANRIRYRVLEHTIANNGGYLSQACSSAELLATLYHHIMKIGPSLGPPVPDHFGGVPSATNPEYTTGASYNGAPASNLDRFFFSPAHYALVLYATLIEIGRMAPEGLAQFNQDGSRVEMIGAEHSPGMEVTTGSLAQGLSQAAGVALARRLRGDTGRCWVFMSDGEWQEGQTWEALEMLAFYHLDNVGVYVDVNGQQCDGRTRDVMDLGDVVRKARAFGAQAHSVDGHDVEALVAPLPTWKPGSPLIIFAATCPWQGVPILKERSPKLHYVRFSSPDERNRYREVAHTFVPGGTVDGNS